MRDALQRAVAVFRNNPQADDSELVDALCAAGIERSVADAVVVFLPIAFTRVVMQKSGVTFSDAYIRARSDGTFSRELSLHEHPVFVAATQLAVAGISPDDLTAVAIRSAEMGAINNALHAGSQLADLVMSPVVVMWDDGFPAFHRRARRRAWWQFWKRR